MRRAMWVSLALWVVTASLFQTSNSLAQEEKAKSSALKVGQEAPDFSLKYFDGAELKDISLKDFKGKKNVVLAFYVFAFTPG
jgi:cytochrome oxidase Cu insertion factor (SCO1/SenC/PrrC family)